MSPGMPAQVPPTHWRLRRRLTTNRTAAAVAIAATTTATATSHCPRETSMPAPLLLQEEEEEELPSRACGLAMTVVAAAAAAPPPPPPPPPPQLLPPNLQPSWRTSPSWPVCVLASTAKSPWRSFAWTASCYPLRTTSLASPPLSRPPRHRRTAARRWRRCRRLVEVPRHTGSTACLGQTCRSQRCVVVLRFLLQRLSLVSAAPAAFTLTLSPAHSAPHSSRTHSHTTQTQQ